ncbi:hypothetical protein HDU76_001647, partial [Blyttiomyces sp. JEL0837]
MDGLFGYEEGGFRDGDGYQFQDDQQYDEYQWYGDGQYSEEQQVTFDRTPPTGTILHFIPSQQIKLLK